jgi:BirA family biotin operon repressor/biotin-[acetyl-CoA-carboxylase] ligase
VIIRKLSRNTREYGQLGSTSEEMHRILEIEDLEEGSVIRADYQSAGKGYQGNTWSSEPGMNLLLSILLKPRSLPVEQAFHLSRIVSLSLVELLEKHEINALIKWPNDIVTGSGKISGILIENSITGDRINHSVIGIGLNVNQDVFDDSIPSPSSMFLEKGCHFDMILLLEEFRSLLERWYGLLISGGTEGIMQSYTGRLYRFGIPSRFSGERGVFSGRICGVLPAGELEVSTEGGDLLRFGFKEIEYLD